MAEDGSGLPRTVCVLPFSQATIANDGRAKLCTHTHASTMESEGRCLSLHSHSLDEIWNSAYLRSVRRRMVEGREVEACARCYATEAEGGTSLRQTMNAHVACRADLAGEAALLGRAEEIVREKAGAAPPPSALHLWLGDLCNLKCRMCSPAFCSLVAADPVQAPWLGGPPRPETGRPDGRAVRGRNWSADEAILFDGVLAHPERLRWINVSGGEPLVHRVFPAILERLVRSGHARHISIYVNTNATRYANGVSALLREFAAVEIAASIDGLGSLQEYMRPPARWETVACTVEAFQRDGIGVSIRPTVQAYNVLDALEVGRWARAQGLRCFFDNVLSSPRWLSFYMQPAGVAGEARQIWQEYREGECAAEDGWHVDTVTAALARPRPDSDALAALQDEFIRFTNDLDRTRGQSFALACPRLHASLVAAGFEFDGKYRFAGGQA
jgi:MoaA/NifB/PqqE/SkfB family radical SAM enzyme